MTCRVSGSEFCRGWLNLEEDWLHALKVRPGVAFLSFGSGKALNRFFQHQFETLAAIRADHLLDSAGAVRSLAYWE